jgi:hypothetical protein
MKKRMVLCIASLLLSIFVVSLAFAGSPFGSNPMEEALEAMEGGSGYVVNKHYVWQWATSYYTFAPDDATPTKGIIIYPGANVDVRSYAVLAKRLAKADYLVALVPMPLDLALLGYNRANRVIDKFSTVDAWAISGHSLGGVMACNYARNNQNKVDGVILLASYPSSSYRLDGTALKVLSIYGTNDGLTTLQDIEDSVAHLPGDTEFYEIDGGNHSQFGYYTPDTAGDNAADISRYSQTYKIYKAIKYWMPDL